MKILEWYMMFDDGHILVIIPPKYAVSSFIGYHVSIVRLNEAGQAPLGAAMSEQTRGAYS